MKKKRKKKASGGKAGGDFVVLGVMTGTSCDGLDAACLAIDDTGWEPLWGASVDYPARLRERVLELQKGQRLSIRELLELDRDLGLWYGQAISGILATPEARRARPIVVANHGQTVAHYPDAGVTLQLGEPSRVARETGLTVVSHFREGDMAAGGQGAPLAPLFHWALAQALGGGRAGISIHNLGGISNLSYIGPQNRVIAFDTGPANIWIDLAAERASGGKLKMDVGGKLAASGRVDTDAVRAVLALPYFAQKPPKSTGRDDFPFDLLLTRTRASGADLVATAAEITIQSVVRAYREAILGARLPLRAIYFSGGGARNAHVLSGISRLLPGVQIGTLEAEGLDPQLIEAQAFAFFAWMTLRGAPLGGSWTGARGFAPPARILPGENWAEVVAVLRGMA